VEKIRAAGPKSGDLLQRIEAAANAAQAEIDDVARMAQELEQEFAAGYDSAKQALDDGAKKAQDAIGKLAGETSAQVDAALQKAIELQQHGQAAGDQAYA